MPSAVLRSKPVAEQEKLAQAMSLARWLAADLYAGLAKHVRDNQERHIFQLIRRWQEVYDAD